MDEIGQLQEILLAQDIAAQLDQRDIKDTTTIAESLISIAKAARDDEDFIAAVHSKNYNISKDFLNSLFSTIQQNIAQEKESLPPPPIEVEK